MVVLGVYKRPGTPIEERYCIMCHVLTAKEDIWIAKVDSATDREIESWRPLKVGLGENNFWNRWNRCEYYICKSCCIRKGLLW